MRPAWRTYREQHPGFFFIRDVHGREWCLVAVKGNRCTLEALGDQDQLVSVVLMRTTGKPPRAPNGDPQIQPQLLQAVAAKHESHVRWKERIEAVWAPLEEP